MEAVTGAKKRKIGGLSASSRLASLNSIDKNKPRVHAQRKFAQGQSIFTALQQQSPVKVKKSTNNGSSSSSTASGPTSKKVKMPETLKKGECPKTEDFLTFLCLRGTNLCPPELDFFNQAPAEPEHSSGEEEEDEEVASAVKPQPKKKVSQKANTTLASTKPLPESVKALKKKYTEQRIARTVITQKMDKVKKAATALDKANRDKSNRANNSSTTKKDTITKPAPPGPAGGIRRGLRSTDRARSSRASRRAAAISLKTKNTVTNSTKRRPSAAAIIAKRKTRMATMRTAVVSSANNSKTSRMLERLTPRGTKAKNFVKKAKRMNLDGKSLRGRDISVSSEEEEEAAVKAAEVAEKTKSSNTTTNTRKVAASTAQSVATDNSTNSRNTKIIEASSTPNTSRKMVCRKTASNVRRESDDTSDEDEDSDEESEDEEDHPPLDLKSSSSKNTTNQAADIDEKKRPPRKTKEAATVYLNMLGQKLTKKSSKDDDISIESLTESTQGKRLEQVAGEKKSKEQQQQHNNNSSSSAKKVEKHLTTPAAAITTNTTATSAVNVSSSSAPITTTTKNKKKEVSLNKSTSGSTPSSGSTSSKDNNKKSKNILKEMQDRLLEEAKKKIASTPEAAPLVQPPKLETENNASKSSSSSDQTISDAERITISQRTGYIQVKPRMSTEDIEMQQQQSSSIMATASTTASAVIQRRLSDNTAAGGGPRTGTPPRKILPKTSETETSSTAVQQRGTPSHLPVGVVGAAMTSSRPPAAVPGQLVTSTACTPRSIPLSQPLLINTCLASGSSVAQIRPMVTTVQPPHPQPQPVQLPQGGIIMSRMPTMQMQPLQLRPGHHPQMQGMPIIMPTQIALANGSILQPVSGAQTSVGPRPPFYPTGQIMTNVPMPMPHQPNMPQEPLQISTHPQIIAGPATLSTSSATTKCTTDVTHANTQPLVSPGPPVLSPQYQQQQQQHQPPQRQQQPTQHANSAPQPELHPIPMPQQSQQQPRHNTKPPTNNPPVLTPAGLPVTSGAVIRSVAPKMKTQFSKMPNPGTMNVHPHQAAAISSNPRMNTAPSMTMKSSAVNVSQADQQNTKQQMQTSNPKSFFSKVSSSSSATSSTTAAATTATTSSTASTSNSSSFKVENEASPYAFETEPLEIRPSVPYNSNSNRKSTKSPAALSPKASKSSSSSKTKKLSLVDQSAQQDLTSQFKDLDSSIPLPAELTNQLVAQAQSEGLGANNETTYFIPLQNSSSGQSFGVAVKLGTEGPPGPDQKVIMKAKLVTQPVGKPLGARVISAGKSPGSGINSDTKNSKKSAAASSAAENNTKKKTIPKKRSAASAALSSSAVKKEAESSSSSSSSDDSDSSADEVDTTPEVKKSKKKSPPKKSKMSSPPLASPKTSDNNKNTKTKKGSSGTSTAATFVPLPITSPTINPSRSEHTSIGTVEALEKFPKLGQHAHLVECPVFKPNESEFKDPMRYIAAIGKIAEPFGICKIIPPASFKPECNVDDDMRFTAYNQYVHKLMNRWGPNSKEMAAIKKYLDTQNVTINANNHPVISGVEIDLPALYHAVQSLGGLTEVIQKKKWGKIAEFLRVPKGTQDRSNKFYDIYCKFLLPYDTLSKVERNELLRLVEEEFEERNKAKINPDKSDDEGADKDESDEDEDEEDEDDECVLKGKSTSLSAFFRVARSLMSMMFKDKLTGTPNAGTEDQQPDLSDVEDEYWKLVQERDSHVQVQQGSIDTGSGSDGYGFPTSRGSSCGRHPWNLKILSNNRQSILRTMGPVMGVTVPTLHLGMLFTTNCWFRDNHGLPWIEYHHTGAPKIWFSIPDSQSIAFYTAMKQLGPSFCRRKKIWLGQDTVMMPPNLLVKHGVSVSRIVQEPGQFIVVFPKAYTSNICTGYTITENVYYANNDYLKYAETEFEGIRDSKDPMLFPLPKLLLCIAKDEKSSRKTLKLVKPLLEKMRDNEYVKRTMISDLSVKTTERINLRSGSKKQTEEDEYECEMCGANLYVSFVCDLKEDQYFCLDCAVKYLKTRKAPQRKHCKLLFTHSKEEISTLIKEVNDRIDDSDEEDDDNNSSDSDHDLSTIPIRRISELGNKSQNKKPPPKKEEPQSPNTSTSSTSSSSSSSSIASPPLRPPKLSKPNVPPGTSIGINSFSMVKQAAKKALADNKSKKTSSNKKILEPESESENDEDDDDMENTSEEDNDSEDSEVQINTSNRQTQQQKKKKKEKTLPSKNTKKTTVKEQDKTRKKKVTTETKKQTPASSKGKKDSPASSSKSKGKSLSAASKKDAASATKKSAKDTKSSKPTTKSTSATTPASGRSGRGGSSGTSLRRKVKARKASNSRTGNLASELLDMLLSSSNDEFEDSHSEQDSSDEAWK